MNTAAGSTSNEDVPCRRPGAETPPRGESHMDSSRSADPARTSYDESGPRSSGVAWERVGADLCVVYDRREQLVVADPDGTVEALLESLRGQGRAPAARPDRHGPRELGNLRLVAPHAPAGRVCALPVPARAATP